MIVVIPADMPLTFPRLSMVAIVVSLLVQMPPDAVSLNVIIEPTHKIDGPVIAKPLLRHDTRT